MRYDVAVIGAGPAGTTAAHHLAAAGVKVVLLERHAIPRYKTCGGGVVRRALSLLPADIAETVQHECRRVRVGLLHRGLSYTCERDFPVISMVMRADMDRVLAERARARGAVLRERCAVRGIVPDNGHLRISTSDGPLEARFVVAGDGATGIASRAAGWGPNPATAPALEAEISVPDHVLERFHGTARFDFGALPHGYAWVFPKRAHLSVGVLSTRHGRVRLQSHLRQYVRTIGIEPVDRVEEHGYVIPLRPRSGPPLMNRTLLTGDAAGLAGPLTAEGISFAAWSGLLAATALVDHLGDLRAVGRCYRRALQRHLLRELGVGRLLAHVVYGAAPLQERFYRLSHRILAELAADVTAGATTYRRVLLRPAKPKRRAAPWPAAQSATCRTVSTPSTVHVTTDARLTRRVVRFSFA